MFGEYIALNGEDPRDPRRGTRFSAFSQPIFAGRWQTRPRPAPPLASGRIGFGDFLPGGPIGVVVVAAIAYVLWKKR